MKTQVPRRALASVDGCDKGPGICIRTWVIHLPGSRGDALLPPRACAQAQGDSDTVHCRTVSLSACGVRRDRWPQAFSLRWRESGWLRQSASLSADICVTGLSLQNRVGTHAVWLALQGSCSILVTEGAFQAAQLDSKKELMRSRDINPK